MAEFETFECTVCGEQFRAYPDANAAENAYCSPACGVEGRDA